MSAVGVTLPRDLPAGQVRDYARRAEELGFDQLWLVEDCFFRGGIAQVAVLLGATTSIHVGLGILPAAARNAAFTALEVAALAELFPGRLSVGLGHGMPDWMRQVGAWPASPLTLLGEHLDAVRRLLHGETVTARGRYVRLDGVRLELPPPVVPPVLAGVRGPKSLALSGRVADGTILAEPTTPEYLAAARESAGDPDPHTWVCYGLAAVDADADAALARARHAIRWVGEADSRPHLAPLPFAGELAELRAAHTSMEDFAAAMPREWVEQLTLTGTPAQARARIGELHDAGADAVVLALQGPGALADLRGLADVVAGR